MDILILPPSTTTLNCFRSSAESFSIDGEGTLLDNMGTNRGSRVVELYNGRAEISLLRNGGKSVVSIQSKELATSFLTVA